MSRWKKPRRDFTSAEDEAVRQAIQCFIKGAPAVCAAPLETATKRLAQRRKQIAIGKKHPSYQRYSRAVPKAERPLADLETYPRTPPPELKCSKRGFDSLLRRWRRALHAWDCIDAGTAIGTDVRVARATSSGSTNSDSEDYDEEEEEEDDGDDVADAYDSYYATLFADDFCDPWQRIVPAQRC